MYYKYLKKIAEDTSPKTCAILMLVSIVIVVLLLLNGSVLDPYNLDGLDDNHATVTITTSAGTNTRNSYNGAGWSISGKKLALKHMYKLKLEKGQTATVSFRCEACGNEQNYTIGEPPFDVLSATILLQCDCPEEINDDGNAREYFAIAVKYTDEATKAS